MLEGRPGPRNGRARLAEMQGARVRPSRMGKGLVRAACSAYSMDCRGTRAWSAGSGSLERSSA